MLCYCRVKFTDKPLHLLLLCPLALCPHCISILVILVHQN